MGLEENRRMVWDKERKEKIEVVRHELLSCCLKWEWQVSIGNMWISEVGFENERELCWIEKMIDVVWKIIRGLI